MIRPSLALSQLSFSEILDACLFILEKDEEQLTNQTLQFKRALHDPKKSSYEIDQWKARLEVLQNRNEFYNELVSRVGSFEVMLLLSALASAVQEAKRRGKPEEYGFSIYFMDGENPQLNIH